MFGALEKWGAALRVAPVEVNGRPGLAAWEGDTLSVVLTFAMRGGVIGGLMAVLNPDKLEFTGRQLARR
jgi:RNA polymerase sigma-70 factor (ECF subfamily)